MDIEIPKRASQAGDEREVSTTSQRLNPYPPPNASAPESFRRAERRGFRIRDLLLQVYEIRTPSSDRLEEIGGHDTSGFGLEMQICRAEQGHTITWS